MFLRFFCRSILIRGVPQIERVCSDNLFKNLTPTFIMPPKRRAATKVVSKPDDNESPIKKRRNAKEPTEVTDTEQENKPAQSKAKTTKTKEKVTKAAQKTEPKPEEQENKPAQSKAKTTRTREKVSKAAQNTEPEPEEQENNKPSQSKAKTTKTKEKVTKAAQKTEPKPAKKESKPSQLKTKTTKTKDKVTKAAQKSEPKAALLNTTETKWENIHFGCEKKNPKGQEYNLKITSWNVDGLRAWLKKGGLDIFKFDDPDILCLQETKCSEEKLPDEVKNIDGYHEYWCASDKEGYAGVAIYTKNKPISVKNGIDNEDHDVDGRCLTLEFKDFFMVNVYVPNAGRGLVTLPKRLDWNESFKAFIKKLDEKKPVILCGDMNVAHDEIDLANPKGNKKNAGFTQEERDGMTDFLEDGYVDSFRELHPDDTDVYTFWTYMSKARAKNIGWRLDYFILSKRIMDNVCDNVVLKDVFGSDHCPITLFIHI